MPGKDGFELLDELSLPSLELKRPFFHLAIFRRTSISEQFNPLS
jgi:hypothetical protein